MKNINVLTLEELYGSSLEGNIPILLTIKHDAISWDTNNEDYEEGVLRLIGSNTAVRYKGKKYFPCHFDFTPPSEDGQKVANTSLSISAIDRTIIEVVRKLRSNPIADIDCFYTKISDTEFVFSKLYQYTFEMSDVTWDEKLLKWSLIFDPVSQSNVPRALGTIQRCPGVNE